MTMHLSTLTAIALTLAPLAALADPVLPDFAAADFSTAGVNPYFPLAPSAPRTIMGSGMEDGEAITEHFTQTVTGPGPVVMGVATVTVLDEAYDGDLLVERTHDFFAADAAGNIWYMGEDVENFRYDANDVLIGTDSHSAWRAGVNGALPGIAMPIDLTPGVPQFQEHAPGEEAMDWAEIVATGLVIDTAAGQFSDVVQVYEASTVEAALREFKYYAPGIGMIRADEGLSEARSDPTLVLELQP